MPDRSVYSQAKEAGVIRLDSDGNIITDAIEQAGAEALEPLTQDVIRLDADGNVVTEEEERRRAEEAKPKPPPIDIEAVRREAYLQGHGDGKREAIQEIQQQLEAFRQNMQALMRNIPASVQQALGQSEPQLLELALGLAKKIIQVESQQNREVIKAVLQAAMQQVRNQTVIAIHLNPQDIAELQPKFAEGRVELIPDPNIQPGGCRIETDLGEVDATLETQWAAAEKALRKEASEAVISEQ